MSKEPIVRTALFTGTFDPFHRAHLWQIERAFAAMTFTKVVVGVIENNPSKPDATPIRHRRMMAELGLGESSLPFAVAVKVIPDIAKDSVRDFVNYHIASHETIRIIGADSLIEFADDPSQRETLTDFTYVIIMRPQVDRLEVEDAVARLPADLASRFKYQIVDINQKDDVSARNLRNGISKSHSDGLIFDSVKSYIEENSLYEM